MNPLPVQELHERLAHMAQNVRSHVPEADRSAQLHADVVRGLIELGLFKLWVPQRYGGSELDLPQTLKIYEAAAAIDGSFGWAVMIGAGGGLFAAYLESSAAEEMFSPANAVVAGSGAPNGRAERVANGFVASGRWQYASGAHYASVFTANCVVTSGGAPVLDADGKPLIRAMSFAPADVTIIPAWNTTGMRGTGSHDFAVNDIFVPVQHTFSVFTDTPHEAGALYRLPFDVLTHLPVAAVGTGIARHALDAFAKLASKKKVHGTDNSLAANPLIRSRYAESHARWLNIHLALHALGSRMWEVALAHRSPTQREVAETTASCTLFLSELELAVSNLARAAGMIAISQDEEFARAWRDLQTLAAHASVSPLQLAGAGELLLEGPDP